MQNKYADKGGNKGPTSTKGTPYKSTWKVKIPL